MHLFTTGQMGAVMQESTSIAFTFARNFLEDITPHNDFFDRASLHMHIPEVHQIERPPPPLQLILSATHL